MLSLGLPPSMIPRGFATAKRQQLNQTQLSATSEAIHHYYETLNPKYANIASIQQQSVQKFEQSVQNVQKQNQNQQPRHKVWSQKWKQYIIN